MLQFKNFEMNIQCNMKLNRKTCALGKSVDCAPEKLMSNITTWKEMTKKTKKRKDRKQCEKLQCLDLDDCIAMFANVKEKRNDD